VLNSVLMRRAVILSLCMCLLFLWAVPSEGSPIGHAPGPKTDSDIEIESGEPGTTAVDRFRMVDQLSGVGIDDSIFFDFSGDGGADPGAARFDAEVFTGGFGGARTSILGFDRGIGFDRGPRFDDGTGFDNGAPFDQGARINTEAGFDSVGGFDAERTLRISEERERSSFLFRREERRQLKPEKEESFLTREEGGGRMESDFRRGETGGDALTRERERLEEELLRSEGMEIRSFKRTERGFLLKIAMFATTLLLLLAGTLKGLIPVKFYFFLTILILILWNPMESLFISIIIGLSALLAPLLG